MQSGPCESMFLMVKIKSNFQGLFRLFLTISSDLLHLVICYCIFGVYLVTGTKNPDISEEGTFRFQN
jgi:hypothetical protein